MRNGVLGLFILFILFACQKDDGSVAPIDKLPAATQTGAQTFGCLVDGDIFLPKFYGPNRLNAFNQQIDGKFHVVISSSNEDETDINLYAYELDAVQEGEYELLPEEPGKWSVLHITGLNNDMEVLTTSISRPGKLTITKHDTDNHILSGTFEYIVQDKNGNDITVTNGRFDVKYTN